MLKKISLSAMTFTYLFAGIVHFTKFDYFLSIAPSFMPYPRISVVLTGLGELLVGLLLPLPLARRWICYCVMFFWSVSLPINIYVLSIGGAGIPLDHWKLAGMIPFHVFLILWAYWHSLPEKSVDSRQQNLKNT